MTAASIFVFDCATAAFSLASIFVNSFTIIYIVYRSKANKRQYEMLLSLIVFHMIFNMSSVLFHICKNLLSPVTVTLWSRSLMLAASATILCGNICIVVDRLLAINHPAAYCHTHKKRWLTFSFFFLVTVFSLSLAAYMYAEYEKKIDYISTPLYIVKSAASALNVLITVGFLWRLRKFMKNWQNCADIENLKTANQIVIYEIVAEIIIIIIPTIVTTVLNNVFNRVITSTVGTYPIALFALYTTVCAICLGAKLMKRSNVVRLFTRSTD